MKQATFGWPVCIWYLLYSRQVIGRRWLHHILVAGDELLEGFPLSDLVERLLQTGNLLFVRRRVDPPGWRR